MPASILDCGSYLVELDAGFTTNQFTLDNPVKGRLDQSTYVLDGTTQYFDVTRDVFYCGIARGRKRYRDPIEAGTCTLKLHDLRGDYTVSNAASPYWDTALNKLGFEATKRVRVSREGQYLFVGQISIYTQAVTLANQSIITISCSDDLLVLNNKKIASHTPSRQTSGERIAAILDRAEVNLFTGVGQRSIATGLANLGAAPVEEGVSVRDYLDRVNGSEFGRIYMTRSGAIKFDRRVDRALLGIDATLGPAGGGAIPFTSLEVVSA